MSESARLIDDIIRMFVAPAMKRARYRKFARNWYADNGACVRMMNVQGSAWNSPDSARFTLNLGVWFEVVADLGGMPPVKNRRPPEYQCTVRERIGSLLDPPGDMWWTVTGPADVPIVGDSVRSVIEGCALPWLEALGDPRTALTHLRAIENAGHSPVTSFAIALSLGERDLAARLYSEWASQRTPGVGENVDRWAAEHGLTS